MKREEKMQKRREEGKKTYSYKKNPCIEGSEERDKKNKSNKLHYAKMTSVFAKLDNRIETEKEEKAKKAREKKAAKGNK